MYKHLINDRVMTPIRIAANVLEMFLSYCTALCRYIAGFRLGCWSLPPSLDLCHNISTYLRSIPPYPVPDMTYNVFGGTLNLTLSPSTTSQYGGTER